MKKYDSEAPGSTALSHPGREKYAHSRSKGLKGTQAAMLCRISKNTGYRWEATAGVKARIAFLTNQSLQDACDENETGIRPITFGRNHVIMGLWDIASKGQSERARVSALMGLADIMLLRAKCTHDLRTGIGWTDDEALHFAKTKTLPARIQELTGCRTIDDLVESMDPPKKRSGN